MQCHKTNALQATSDIEPIMADTFILDGVFTDLYLYPQELRLLQKGNSRIVPLRFGMTFNLLTGSNSQPQALQFSDGEETIRLERDFWPRLAEWQSVLLKYLIRKDFHSFFKPIKKIGRGNFATVYLAEETKTSRCTAIKAFMKETAFKGNGLASIDNEIKIMRKLRNPNLIEFYGAYETKNSLYLSMQYAQGITLESFLRRNPQPTLSQRRKILKGLLLGLKELSRLRIVHRDIKPENIVVSQDCETVKIVDFGLATQIDEQKYIFLRCGTPGFVAPQILSIRDNQKVKLSCQSDVFSVGAIYYHLLYGHPLFKGKNQAEVLNLNRHTKIRLTHNDKAVPGQLQLLHSMLQIDPTSRTTPQLALKNPYLAQHRNLFIRALQPKQISEASNWIIVQQ